MSEDRNLEPAQPAGFPLAGVAVFALMLSAWIVLFQFLGNSTLGYFDSSSLLKWWWNLAVNSVDADHLFLIPLLVAGLLWYRWHALSVLAKQVWWPALIVVVGAMLLHIFAFLIQQPKGSVIAFFVGIIGMAGLVWGREWFKATLFPLGLILLCVPLGESLDFITNPLRLLATELSVGISHGILGIDVIHEGTRIFDSQRTYEYDVAPACSGIRSLTMMLVLTMVYGFMSFPAWWKRGFIISLAIPLAIAGNVLRLMTIIVAAEGFGQKAGNYVHESGWLSLLPYVPAFLGVAVAGHFLRNKTTEKTL